jgi:hypothetical protein
MRTILFNGTQYPVVDFIFPDGERSVATWSLNQALFTEEECYVSIEAQNIDETIFYFVEDEQIYLPEKELILEITQGLV